MFWKQSTASIHVFYKYEIAQKDGGVKKNLSEDPEAADIIDVPFPETPTSFLKEEWKKIKKINNRTSTSFFMQEKFLRYYDTYLAAHENYTALSMRCKGHGHFSIFLLEGSILNLHDLKCGVHG